MSELTFQATRPGSRIRRPKRYSEGRVCINQECDTIMSRYNQAEHCFRHAPTRYPRLRGMFTDEHQGDS